MGRLIVIDGLDSSGKETHCKLVEEKIKKSGKDVIKLSFPNYDKDYCAPIKMYLSGKFGKNPNDVNPYGASIFYTVDRFASYKEGWEEDYNKTNNVIIADRYTTSNAIHQGVKVEDEKREEFFAWLYDFEFNKVMLPRPDMVIFLDMPPKKAIELMEKRANKATGEIQKDIHEKDHTYLFNCYDCALQAARYYGWEIIRCVDECGNLRTIEQINEEIMRRIYVKI